MESVGSVEDGQCQSCVDGRFIRQRGWVGVAERQVPRLAERAWRHEIRVAPVAGDIILEISARRSGVGSVACDWHKQGVIRAKQDSLGEGAGLADRIKFDAVRYGSGGDIEDQDLVD